MIRLLGVGAVLAAMTTVPLAVAQLPMSPVYRTETEKPPPITDKTGAAAHEIAPAKAEPPPEERASPMKPEAFEQKPVATAPIPPPPSLDNAANDSGRTESGPRPTSAAETHTSDTAAAAAPSPPRSAPASKKGDTGATPSAAVESATAPKPAAPETPASSAEASADHAVAAPPEENKTPTRKGRRHARTHQYARRPGPTYYYPPPAYYTPSPYSGASRGYGGGAYGPSPYSSDGP